MTFLDIMEKTLKVYDETLSSCWRLITTCLMTNKTHVAAEIQETGMNNSIKFCTELSSV